MDSRGIFGLWILLIGEYRGYRVSLSRVLGSFIVGSFVLL